MNNTTAPHKEEELRKLTIAMQNEILAELQYYIEQRNNCEKCIKQLQQELKSLGDE